MAVVDRLVEAVHTPESRSAKTAAAVEVTTGGRVAEVPIDDRTGVAAGTAVTEDIVAAAVVVLLIEGVGDLQGAVWIEERCSSSWSASARSIVSARRICGPRLSCFRMGMVRYHG
jgi:hypothetical protein